jgi:signal transduction histidine kinase
MRIRNLYLNIYLTVLAVLLVFALVAGLLVRRHAEAERLRIESALSERAVAWAELIEKGLPPATAPDAEQQHVLMDWAHRLRLAVALNAADGHRIATSERFAEARVDSSTELKLTRTVLGDGRVLLIAPLRLGWRRFGPPPGPPPGLPPGAAPPTPTLPAFERRPPVLDGVIDGLLQLGREWFDEGTTLLALLTLLFVFTAIGSYPLVRRLTRRLESLQRGVEVFGSGELSHRIAEDGGDEVATVAASFNRAADRIEGLVRANRSLLANASHELRSPLARMKMALAMLEHTPLDQRPDLRREIERDIGELDALVEEVLLASRLDAQAGIADDPVDVLAVAAEEAARVGAQVEVDAAGAALRLRGDERLLRRALRNLLENAQRYGGGDVFVEIVTDAAAQRVRLAVCDRGPGVPEAERERIFEPFYRLPGHSEKAGGVGLGLSLVRQIAGRHHGEVRCEAREGGGSRFVLSLPFSQPRVVPQPVSSAL